MNRAVGILLVALAACDGGTDSPGAGSEAFAPAHPKARNPVIPMAGDVDVEAYPGAMVVLGHTPIRNSGLSAMKLVHMKDGVDKVYAFYSGKLKGWNHHEWSGNRHVFWKGDPSVEPHKVTMEGTTTPYVVIGPPLPTTRVKGHRTEISIAYK